MMKTMRIPLLLVMATCGLAQAGSIRHSVSLDAAGIQLRPMESGVSVSMPGLESSSPPGAPLLPVVPVTLVLPAGSTDICFGVEVTRQQLIASGLGIRPASDLRPLDWSGRMEALPDPLIYRSQSAWPESILVTTHVGRLCGFTVASCLVMPWRYVPSTGELSLCREFDVLVSWSQGSAPWLTESQMESASRRIAVLVDNPSDIPSCAPPVRADRSGDCEWVAICDSSYVHDMEPLRLHWEVSGRSAAILPIQQILSSSPGMDDAERLRNAIDSLRSNCGTVYVLLAGDETLLPVRTVYSECEGYYDNMPCDYYFSDLDGTWDASGDGVYGQPDDSLDMYMDVLLARAPFGEHDDAGIFVGKTLAYLEAPPTGPWSRTALLCAAMLFPSIGYTGAKGADSVSAAIPGSWLQVKIYEQPSMTDGSDTQIDWLRSGTGWNYYAGHGNNRGIYWCWPPYSMITSFMVDTLQNGPRTGVHTSIACYSGDFEDGRCCAEALLLAPDGGGVSATFNTSVGWEGYWPEIGVSEWLCILFTRATFVDHMPTLGESFASAKDRRVPFMHGGYDRNLQAMLAWSAFHDPALKPFGVPPDIPVEPVPLAITAPWPNPATREAPISFVVDYTAGLAEVSVHDLAGRLLWSTTLQSPGSLQWSGLTREGRRLPAGVYIISARRGDYIVSRLVTILD
jgi:hypothetical protein